MQEKVPTSTHSVRLEPTILILVGTRTTYQATRDAESYVHLLRFFNPFSGNHRFFVAFPVTWHARDPPVHYDARFPRPNSVARTLCVLSRGSWLCFKGLDSASPSHAGRWKPTQFPLKAAALQVICFVTATVVPFFSFLFLSMLCVWACSSVEGNSSAQQEIQRRREVRSAM